mmetsp:Transcript_39772/g.119575  ORF Transcript_39772/g.119575 Transcript_39772/m.119575 type:complete len:192 (-) Transcript_39772:446-1021(-)
MSPDTNAMKNPSYGQVCSGETGEPSMRVTIYVRRETRFRCTGCARSNKPSHCSQYASLSLGPSLSGHVEVLDVTLNDPAEHLEPLLQFFYAFHDPTTMNRQGNDAGTQYASAIFTSDEEQERIARAVTDGLQNSLHSGFTPGGYFGNMIATAIVPYTEFYPAHEEHQEYLAKNPNGYCNHYIRFKEWPSLN